MINETGIEKIREFFDRSLIAHAHGREFDINTFTELIVRECVKIAHDEIVSDIDIAESKNVEEQQYLKGNNGGVVDVICAIKQHFGVES